MSLCSYHCCLLMGVATVSPNKQQKEWWWSAQCFTNFSPPRMLLNHRFLSGRSQWRPKGWPFSKTPTGCPCCHSKGHTLRNKGLVYAFSPLGCSWRTKSCLSAQDNELKVNTNYNPLMSPLSWSPDPHWELILLSHLLAKHLTLGLPSLIGSALKVFPGLFLSAACW